MTTKWRKVAEDLINSDWGTTVEYDDANRFIREFNDQKLILIMLIDIAKSLRVLRCSNFLDIPRRLDRVRIAAEGTRREASVRRRKR